MNFSAHQFIVDQVLNFLENEELNKYKKAIRLGIEKPDRFKIPRISHFYHPFRGRGWLFFSAKNRGIKSFNKAIRYYQKSKNEKCFFALGKSLHYLADLAVPAHTQVISHIFDTDDLENYLKENFNKVELSIKSENKNLNSCFEDLAKISFSLKCFPNSFLTKLNIFSKKEQLSPQELEEQAKTVLSAAINYSISLLGLFIRRKTKRYKRNKKDCRAARE